MDEHSSALDFTFAALAHPTRRRLLELLVGGERRVTDLAAEFSSSLNVVSRHIRSLERAGLVRRHRDGRVHRLRFEAAPLAEATAIIEHYRTLWSRQLDQLGSYLDTMAKSEATHAPDGKSSESH